MIRNCAGVVQNYRHRSHGDGPGENLCLCCSLEFPGGTYSLSLNRKVRSSTNSAWRERALAFNPDAGSLDVGLQIGKGLRPSRAEGVARFARSPAGFPHLSLPNEFG